MCLGKKQFFISLVMVTSVAGTGSSFASSGAAAAASGVWLPVAEHPSRVLPQHSDVAVEQKKVDTATQLSSFAPQAVLRLSLLDAPFHARHGYSHLSMSQSLNIARSWHSAVHWSLAHVIHPEPRGFSAYLNVLAYLVANELLATLPLSPAWMHEEWHRAVMLHRGIASRNTINELKPFQSNYSVNGVSDEDLIRLKQLYPKDQLRLSIAGDESEREFVLSLEKDRFYRNQNTADWAALALTTLGSVFYLQESANGNNDALTSTLEKSESIDVHKRDFIGMDYLGWVRDLHRPEESFASRGVHPSGVGVRRYTKRSDLTQEEADYLSLQAMLHYLNFISPQMFGWKQWTVTSPTTGRALGLNTSLAHYLTPFGYALKLNMFMKTLIKETPFGTQGLFFAWQQNFNKSGSFPQIEIEHRPLMLKDSGWGLGARVMAWLQPEGSDFFAQSSQSGGLLGVKLIHKDVLGIQPWFEAEAKSAGWVAGQVDLGRTYTLRAGFEALL